MDISTKEKYTLITAADNFKAFSTALKNQFDEFKNQNLVIDLSKTNATDQEVASLIHFAEIQTESNSSFVIIIPSFDADAFDEELNVVPTLIEAEDMIDMDEMTRDLGF
ncbi:hypothetical protein [Ochrovirga pacifica]|uniref:hypothetical protein n=1 Tax=Ochrovirga pacifica TaxID=1042376 RepID=UPI0002558747|nr:hypothetical protein [Ochrovirga pacifica]